jgi:hypothetical protein
MLPKKKDPTIEPAKIPLVFGHDSIFSISDDDEAAAAAAAVVTDDKQLLVPDVVPLLFVGSPP